MMTAGFVVVAVCPRFPPGDRFALKAWPANVVVAVCPRFPPGDRFALPTWPANVIVCRGDRSTFPKRWVTAVAALSVRKPVRSGGGGGGGGGRACKVPSRPAASSFVRAARRCVDPRNSERCERVGVFVARRSIASGCCASRRKADRLQTSARNGECQMSKGKNSPRRHDVELSCSQLSRCVVVVDFSSLRQCRKVPNAELAEVGDLSPL